jgi:uncharacterized protein (UPF0335 family)
MTDQYQITAEQLRSFLERYERLEAEKQDILAGACPPPRSSLSPADQQKKVLAEAKGCGYDTATMREIIKLRKMDPDERAEKEAILQMYLEALWF